MNDFRKKQTEPLICERFWARLSIADRLGHIVFLNGQTFKLTVEEVGESR